MKSKKKSKSLSPEVLSRIVQNGKEKLHGIDKEVFEAQFDDLWNDLMSHRESYEKRTGQAVDIRVDVGFLIQKVCGLQMGLVGLNNSFNQVVRLLNLRKGG